MLIEPRTIRLAVALFVATIAAATTALLLLLFHENVEDLLGVHATILLVDQANRLARQLITRHSDHVLVLVHVKQLDVDDIVTGLVGDASVLLIQRPPCGQVSVALVHVLVQHEESKLLV